jgi:hypothetical protein
LLKASGRRRDGTAAIRDLPLFSDYSKRWSSMLVGHLALISLWPKISNRLLPVRIGTGEPVKVADSLAEGDEFEPSVPIVQSLDERSNSPVVRDRVRGASHSLTFFVRAARQSDRR